MSVVFYLFALVLVALAVLIIVPVVLRQPPLTEHLERHRQNIRVARQRLAELKQRETANEIEAADAELIREEIERGLLDDIDEQTTDESDVARQGSVKAIRWVATGIAIFIPLAAGTMYLAVGEPGGVSHQPRGDRVAAQQSPAPDAETGQAQSFEQLTQRLLTHLATETDDVLGWRTLAQLFVAQQRFSEAAGAYKMVRELEGDSAENLVREADAVAMANNGVLQGQPERLIEAALQLDPEYTGALWLAGLAAGERGDVAVAVDYWMRAEQTTDNEEMLAEIRRLIESGTAELARIEGQESSGSTPSASPAITVTASVDQKVLAEVNPDTTVFIFARAHNGPPAPLAVVKKQVKDLPITVVLDDSLAMLPNLNISAFEQVFVVARISFAGTPQAQSGDYFGQSAAIRPGIDQDALHISISERVP